MCIDLVSHCRWYLLSASITVGANAIIIGEGFAALVASSKSPLWSNKAAPAPLIATPVGSTVNIMNLMFTSDGDGEFRTSTQMFE